MKTNLKCCIVPVAVSILVLGQVAAALPPAASSVALLSKVVLDVSRKEEGGDWQNAKKGETLASGDKVKTGMKSVAII
jgi:Na+/H+-translocating membrane pyrophosphatase